MKEIRRKKNEELAKMMKKYKKKEEDGGEEIIPPLEEEDSLMKSVEDEEDEVLEPLRKKIKVNKPSKIEKGECPSCFQKLAMKTLIKYTPTCWGLMETRSSRLRRRGT